MTDKLESCPFSEYSGSCETGPTDKSYCDLCLKGKLTDRLFELSIAVEQH